MDSPVFKLEGIVRTKDEMSDFEGPLTLILQLLSNNKVEIRDISISLILEQYLEYLEKMAELNLDIAGDFVAMASHLAYIKTKMLLTEDEVISEIEQLISSLEELRRGDVYLQIKEAALTLSEMYKRGGSLMAGPPEYLPQEGYSYVHISSDLVEAILGLISRENAVIGSLNPREAAYPQRVIYSIPEKISEILDKLKLGGPTPVSELFSGCKSKAELVATLVAILELCKVGSVTLTGSDDDITAAYSGTGRDPVAADFTEDTL